MAFNDAAVALSDAAVAFSGAAVAFSGAAAQRDGQPYSQNTGSVGTTRSDGACRQVILGVSGLLWNLPTIRGDSGCVRVTDGTCRQAGVILGVSGLLIEPADNQG